MAMPCLIPTCVESRAQSEHLFGQLEAQFNDLHEAHKTVTEEKTRLVAALKEASEARDAQKSEALKHQRRAEEAEQQSHRLDLALKREKEESESARQQVDQRQRDLDRVQTDFKTVSDRLNEAGKREASLSSELSSVRSALVPLQLHSERLSEEKTLWVKQKTWLEGELEARSNALLEARKQASAKEVELTSQLERARQEVSAHERRAKEAIEELGSTRQRLNEASLKLQSSETASSRKNDGLSRELASLSKLCALHEENASSATKRVAELEAHSSAFRLEAEGALRKASEDSVKALLEARAEHERLVAELKKDVRLLQEQLASEKKAAAERVSPAAQVLAALENDASLGGAATSTALELLSRASSSKQGGVVNDLTATALYSRVVVAEGALTKEKDESNKLRTYLGQILHEIELKAPLIAQQRRDYERALIAHEELSRRLAATSRDAAQASADLGAEKDARGRADTLAASLQGEVADLKKQVLALIRAGKNAAHTNPGGDAFTLDDLSSSSANNASSTAKQQQQLSATTSAVRSNGWPTTDAHLLQLAAQDDPAARDKLSEAAASAIIDESLLTYADVKELQERNQQLIRVLRLLARQLGKLSSASNNGSSLDVSLGGSSSSSNSMMLGASGFGGSGIGFGPAGSSAREALVALHNELSELRASRERQSAMVAAVAHQRDMYRMLLSQADSSLLAKGDANVGGGEIIASTQQLTAGVSSPSGGAGPDTTTRGAALGLSQLTSSSARDNISSRMSASSSSAVTAMAQATADNLQAMLDEARGELERTRSDARSAIKAAEARTEQLRNECVELNKTMIAAQGEARFQTERATQLQHSADASKEEASRELKRSLHLQDLVVRHQRELADREAALSHARDELVSLRTSIANSNAERDIALASEARLSSALKEAVQERDRQMRLAEKLHSFESEVSARETAERAERAEERATLQREWMSARQLLEEERVLSQQRTQQHTVDLKESTRRCDDLSQELTKAQKDVQSSQAEASLLRTQVSSLSEQLSLLHSRLEGRLSQLGARGDVDASRLSQLEVTVTSLESELSAAKAALENKERHAAEYKAIAEAAEDAARIMRESQGKAVAAVQVETTKALAELASAKAAANATAETLDKVRAEAVAASGEWFKTEDSLKSQILSLSQELKTANEKSLTFSQHEAQLVADMKRLDEARERAQANYDMQLQMHAADGRTLKELQEKTRALDDSAVKARDEAARSQAALITSQQVWAAKEASLTSAQSELKASLTNLKDQNALLHSSLTALGAELDKLRTKTTPAETAHSSSLSSSAAATSEDIEALRVSSTQLREVVAYLRRQNEVLESKKDLAEQRLQNAEEVAEQKQKTLDEVRAYGKRLQEQLSAIQSAPIEGSTTSNSINSSSSSASSSSSPGGVPSHGGGGLSVRVLTLDEHQRLLEKVSQVALLFESNKLLREENERSAASKQEAEKRSAELAATVGPLQAAQRAFTSEKQAWESERSMLKEESALWKTRLEGVFAARDAVDPAVHRALAEQLEALQTRSAEQVAKLTKAIARADEAQRIADEYKALAESKASELASKMLEFDALSKDLEAKTKDVEAKTKDIETLESSKTQMRTATISWKKKFEEASQKLKDLAPPQSPAAGSSLSSSAAAAAPPTTAASSSTDNSAAIAVAVAAAKESLTAQHLAAIKAQKDEHVKQLEAAKQAVAAAQQALSEAQTRFDAEKSRIETHFTNELAAVRSALAESEAKTKKAGEAYTKVKTVYDKLVADLKKKKFEEEAAATAAAIQTQSANAAATAFAAATSILPASFSSSSAAAAKTSAATTIVPAAITSAQPSETSNSASSSSSSSSLAASSSNYNNETMSGSDSFVTSTVSPQLPFRSIVGGAATDNVLTFGVAPKLPVVAASSDAVTQKAFVPSFSSTSSSPTLFGSGTPAPVFGSASSTLSFGTSSNQMFAIGSMGTTAASSTSSSVSPGGLPSSSSSLNPLAASFVPPAATVADIPAATPTAAAKTSTTAAPAAAPAASVPSTDAPAPQSARKQKPQKSTKKTDSLQPQLPVEIAPNSLATNAPTLATIETAAPRTSGATPTAEELLKRRAARFAATMSDSAGNAAGSGAIAIVGGDKSSLDGSSTSSSSVTASGQQRLVRTKRKLEEAAQSITAPIISSGLGSSALAPAQPLPSSEDNMVVDESMDSTKRPKQSSEAASAALGLDTHHSSVSTAETHIAASNTNDAEGGASSRKIARRDAPPSPPASSTAAVQQTAIPATQSSNPPPAAMMMSNADADEGSSAIAEDLHVGNDADVRLHHHEAMRDDADVEKDETQQGEPSSIQVDDAVNDDANEDGGNDKGNDAIEIHGDKHAVVPVDDGEVAQVEEEGGEEEVEEEEEEEEENAGEDDGGNVL